jgi:hypothetical protein
VIGGSDFGLPEGQTLPIQLFLVSIHFSPHHSLFGVAFSFCPFLSSHNITSSNNIIMLPIHPATRTTIVLLFLLLVQSSNSMQIFKYWAERHKCIAVIKPVWPFALAKSATQAYEEKGRSASNFQHLGHDCNTRGGRTKCRICEDIQCGPGQAQICPLQIQGMDATNLPKNIPTISDAPWAIGGRHRYDFKRATHVCVVLGKECARPDTVERKDFEQCNLRCWGWNTRGQQTELPATIFSLRWTTLTTDFSDLSSGNMQGRVLHMAGKGTPGKGEIEKWMFVFITVGPTNATMPFFFLFSWGWGWGFCFYCLFVTFVTV